MVKAGFFERTGVLLKSTQVQFNPGLDSLRFLHLYIAIPSFHCHFKGIYISLRY